MSSITVRAARPGDEGLIVALIRELAEYEKAPHEAIATESLIHEALFTARPSCEALIGGIHGEDLGFALYFHNFSTWKGRRGLYLEDLFVRPGARGKGLGLALFQAVAAIAVERGCPRMEWNVLDWNEPALRFYRSLGAEPLSEWTIHRLSGDALLRAAGR